MALTLPKTTNMLAVIASAEGAVYIFGPFGLREAAERARDDLLRADGAAIVPLYSGSLAYTDMRAAIEEARP